MSELQKNTSERLVDKSNDDGFKDESISRKLKSKEIERIGVNDATKSETIKNILDNVIKVQASYGNVLSDADKENARTVIRALLEENKDGKPMVVDLAMGKGKSLILLEFIKYKCKIDENFSAIIVKKTLEEAKEFVLGLGLRDKETFPLDGDYEALKDKYFIDEDLFIAKLIRGFNSNDCVQYKEMLSEVLFGNSEFDENDFTHYLCAKCTINNCKVKQSKQQHKQHRVIVITHARLFLSNDNNDIMDRISEWEDEKGQKHKRKMLLIDEKINTFDMHTVKLKEWKTLKSIIVTSNLDKKIKEQVHEIDNYLSSLKYPDNDKEIIEIMPCDGELQLNSEIIKFLLMQKIEHNIINTIDKFLKYGGYIGRDWKKTKDEQFSYCKYIDVKEYGAGNFGKCIIFDATSKNDYDYNKSDINFLDNLQNNTNYQVDINKNSIVSLGKGKIIGKSDYKRNMNLICEEIKEVIVKTNKKTLVIVYKGLYDSIGKKYNLKGDIENKLSERGIDTEYEVIHFGQYTTGVNHFKDYETIIFIGQLHKGTYYYGCKSLCIGLDAVEIKINEFLIESIQQIGRIGIRKGKKVDVYMIGADDKLMQGLQDFFKSNVNNWFMKKFNEFSIANDIQKGKPWYKIVEFVLEQLKDVGHYIRKGEIKEYVVKNHGVNIETYRDALTNPKTLNILSGYGIIEKEDNRQMFVKVE